MKEALVFGIGNRLMMDDGVGVYVVEELNQRNTNSSIRYVVGETDINYCLGQIAESTNIAIVDAARLGKRPGDVSIISLEHLSRINNSSLSLHESHLLNEITLLNKKIKGILIAIEPYEIGYGIGLTANLNKQFSEIVNELGNIIRLYVQSLNMD